MTKPDPFVLLTGLIIASIVSIAGYLWYKHPPQTEEISWYRPDFSLPDLQGEIRRNSEWDGKVVIVNFWATWCPPCVKEIPMFIKLQEKYAERGLQFVGIATNDYYEAVADFVKDNGINYPVLIGEQEAIDVAISFGNRVAGLPFTVVIDRKGNIVFRHIGEMKQQQTEQIILPLFK
jgi:thiol-disulfide isomerase/thioredoxin